MPIGELHHTHRLPVTLGVRHAVVAVDPILHVTALLVPDQHDGLPAKPAEPGNDRGVVRVMAIAVQLEPVVEEPLDVIEGVRPILGPRELDRAPDLLVAGLLDEVIELLLEPLEIALEARAAEQRQALQPAQLVPQPELGLTRHRRRAAAAWPRSPATRVEGRWRRRGRASSST